MHETIEEKREKHRKYCFEWRQKNRERYRAVQKEYDLKNREKKNLQRREKAKLRSRKYRLENRERYLAIRRAWEARNKTKLNAKALAWYKKNRDKELLRMRKLAIKRNYGLTWEQYRAMGDACHMCGATEDQYWTNDRRRKKMLSVDHDKISGRVRGLLCGHCNTAIGLLKHNIELLMKAIAYLETDVDYRVSQQIAP